ncbi:hypothetical protein [Streptomyces glaucescens]|uniref:Uncharacterized protein n=1 Tax=Streptomyces glaucescens TaxID=1907 RepID=A0A089XJE9_STRGA|nr:hypothetical protein [Streptomyces glaucescens]AIS02097.1 hypothetical protein SGLAU_30815 [Streptomyces glaucescens]
MRKRAWWILPVAGAAAVGVHRARSRTSGDDRTRDRWLTVTVNRPAEEVRPGGQLPPPLRPFDDRIEVDVRPAPGDRGTELAVRLKQPPGAARTSLPGRLAGQDPRQELRLALREAKALLEAGEVLHPDTPSTTRETPGGKLVGLLVRRSGGEGVL